MKQNDVTLSKRPDRTWATVRSFQKLRLVEFPAWLDPHLFLAWLLTLPAVMPLLQPTITRSADGLLHLYRLVALDHVIQQGLWFPRWLPDLAYGYGFPLFVFYAPLSYYITLALKMSGLDIVIAFNASFILALLVAGSGAYLFIKELFGPRAGLLGSLAYVYAPFQVLNILSRGGLPAAWAMAIFPFAFWLFSRLIKQATGEKPLISLISFSAFAFGLALLTHNTLSLLFVPLFGVYLGIELFGRLLWQSPANVSEPRSSEPLFSRLRYLKRAVTSAGLALSLGLGLAAFFLIPALVEKEFAQVDRVIISPDFDFRFNFVTLAELFSLPAPANTGLLNPKHPFTLGLTQAGLAIIGLVCLLGRTLTGTPGENPPHSPIFPPSHLSILIFTILSLTVTIFMMLPVSGGIWEPLPLLAFVQFPHRLLGPAALILAMLAGAAAAMTSERVSFWMSLSGVTLIFITTVPLLYQPYNDHLPDPPTLVDMMAYEHASGVIGTTSFGEYLPIWVKEIPRGSPLEPMYQANSPIHRLDPAYLPDRARIESASYVAGQAELVIDSPEPFQAIFHTFYFPGWAASINGKPSPVTPVTERGLIGIDLPAGRQQLQLYFLETPVRRAANLVSIISLVTLLAMAAITTAPRFYATKITGPPSPAYTGDFSSPILPGFKRPQLIALTGLALTLIILKAAHFDQYDNPLKHAFNGQTVRSSVPSEQVNFAGQISLIGYELDRRQVTAGQSLELTAYWQARQPAAIDYSSLAQLVDAEKHLYAGQDNLHPGLMPTTQWPVWGFVQDVHTMRVPPGTPPGDYFLVTGLYDPKTWARLPVVNNHDSTWPDVAAIPVTISKPAMPPEIAELGIVWPIETEITEAGIGSELRLLGATPERQTIRSNDFFRLAVFWEAKRPPTQNYRVSLRLLTSSGREAVQETNQPSHNRYPTTLWQAGERVRDNHALWIPSDFSAGAYQVQLRILAENGRPINDWLGLGTLSLSN